MATYTIDEVINLVNQWFDNCYVEIEKWDMPFDQWLKEKEKSTPVKTDLEIFDEQCQKMKDWEVRWRNAKTERERRILSEERLEILSKISIDFKH